MSNKEKTTRKNIWFYSDNELEELLDVSKTTMWRLRRAGKFPKKVQLSQNISKTRAEEAHEWKDDPEAWPKNHSQEVVE